MADINNGNVTAIDSGANDTSGSEQQIVGSDRVATSTNHEAIDPTAGIRTPGQRGRHKSDCECDKCVTKRSSNIDTARSSGKRESKPSVPKADTKLVVNSLALQLAGVHKIAALVTKDPVWIITDAESEELAKAIKDVMALHQINISPSMIAYGKLIAVSGAIYAPRVGVKMMQKVKQKQAQQQADILSKAGSASATMGVDLNATNTDGKIKYQ